MPDDPPIPEPGQVAAPFPEAAGDAGSSTAKPATKPPRPTSPRGKTAQLELRQKQATVESAEADTEAKRQEIARRRSEFRQLLGLRWFLGLAALAIVVWWQFRILGVVERQGTKELDIPDAVLLALVSTTTVNVFGFLLIVHRFVFPQPPKPKP